MRGESWTREKDEYLVTLFNKGNTYKEIGLIFNTTEKAIGSRIFVLRQQRSDIKKKTTHFTPEQDQLFNRLYFGNERAEEIATQLKLPLETIINKIDYMRTQGMYPTGRDVAISKEQRLMRKRKKLQALFDKYRLSPCGNVFQKNELIVRSARDKKGKVKRYGFDGIHLYVYSDLKWKKVVER